MRRLFRQLFEIVVAAAAAAVVVVVAVRLVNVAGCNFNRKLSPVLI